MCNFENVYFKRTNYKFKLNIMKNLVKSTLYLTVFALAGILFQISCSSDSITPSSVGKIVYTKRIGLDTQIWLCDYDGTNQTQIPLNLPSNVLLNYVYNENSTFGGDETSVKLSPDGQKVFFETVTNPNGNRFFSIYSCDISGSNLTEIVTEGFNQNPLRIGGVN